jgi:hypothetical protein
MDWSWVALLSVLAFLLGTVWALARAAGRADAERDAARLARDAEEIAREIRRGVAREHDPNERLRDWSRD